MVHSLENGGHLEFGIFKATMHSKCKMHIINQPSNLKIYKEHVSHYIMQKLRHDYGFSVKEACMCQIICFYPNLPYQAFLSS